MYLFVFKVEVVDAFESKVLERRAVGTGHRVQVTGAERGS
jgi:hypothetical protein